MSTFTFTQPVLFRLPLTHPHTHTHTHANPKTHPTETWRWRRRRWRGYRRGAKPWRCRRPCWGASSRRRRRTEDTWWSWDARRTSPNCTEGGEEGRKLQPANRRADPHCAQHENETVITIPANKQTKKKKTLRDARACYMCVQEMNGTFNSWLPHKLLYFDPVHSLCGLNPWHSHTHCQPYLLCASHTAVTKASYSRYLGNPCLVECVSVAREHEHTLKRDPSFPDSSSVFAAGLHPAPFYTFDYNLRENDSRFPGCTWGCWCPPSPRRIQTRWFPQWRPGWAAGCKRQARRNTGRSSLQSTSCGKAGWAHVRRGWVSKPLRSYKCKWRLFV